MDWKRKLGSRKFWMAVASAVILIANDGLGIGLPEETLLAFVAVVITWILGESYVDAKH